MQSGEFHKVKEYMCALKNRDWKLKYPKLSLRRSRCGFNEKGQSIPELALVITAFFLFLFGIFEFGIIAYTYHFVSNEAQEAARWAMVHGSESPTPATAQDVADYVKNPGRLPSAIDPAKMTVTAEWPGDVSIASCPANSNEPGCPVKITIQYDYDYILPFMPSNGLAMSRSSQMVISY